MRNTGSYMVEAFIGMMIFTRKPAGTVWMLVKMLRPHLRENRSL